MKVIVTGGSGFVGKETINYLVRNGYNVFNYDLLEGYDVCNRALLEDIIEEGDKILHLAAVSRFKAADLDPQRAFSVNVGGTYNVLDIARKKGAERVVYSSTGSVYMPVQKTPITENHPIRGNSPYATSKALADKLCQDFMGDNLKIVVLRYAHLYGPTKKRNAIYNFITRLDHGLKPMIYGGKQSNDFTYIKDVVQANLLALETPNVNECYNIGTGEEIPILKAVNIIKDILGSKEGFNITASREVDPERFVFDISKAREKLGYEPQYKFEDGVRETIRLMKLEEYIRFYRSKDLKY